MTITQGIFTGPAGPLEYILTQPERQAERAAVLCHPHPLYGGTMHTRIVFQMSRTLAERGLAVLRFNFRGVGKSAGRHDFGAGERQDVAAALAWQRERFGLPLVLGGFSFGAATAVQVLAAGLAAGEAVERCVLAGLPVDRAELPSAWRWEGPKLLLGGDDDEFASRAGREAYFAGLSEPKRRVWLAGGDHFLAGKMEEFNRALAENLDFA